MSRASPTHSQGLLGPTQHQLSCTLYLLCKAAAVSGPIFWMGDPSRLAKAFQLISAGGNIQTWAQVLNLHWGLTCPLAEQQGVVGPEARGRGRGMGLLGGGPHQLPQKESEVSGAWREQAVFISLVREGAGQGGAGGGQGRGMSSSFWSSILRSSRKRVGVRTCVRGPRAGAQGWGGGVTAWGPSNRGPWELRN